MARAVKSGRHASGVFSFHIRQLSGMSLDHSARVQIARLWLDGSESVGRSAARFGISHQKICERTRREKWPLRRRADASGDPDGLVQCDAATGAPVRGISVVDPGTRPDRVDDGQGSGGQAGFPPAGERVARRDRAAARQEMIERLFGAKVDQS